MIKNIYTSAIVVCLLMFANPSYSQFTGIYTGKPTYEIQVKRSGNNLGTINIELFPNIAPNHTRNFDSLVSEQFYDSTAFHRVIPGFMIQGGDPNSRSGPVSTWGYGDPNQPTVNAEFSVAKHVRGILSAARDADPNSANSQFFICVATASWLNNQYSVYGQVRSGMNIVDSIVNSPRDANDNPLQKIEMFITRSGSNDTVPNAPLLNTPVSGSIVTGTSKLLKWFAVSDAIYYHLDVSTDSNFTTLFKSVDIAAIANSVTGLNPMTRYYWRVRSNNGGHWSSNSPTWYFNTSSGVGIEPYSEPEKISVYPNPSEGKFTFAGLEAKSTLLIFDLSGKCIFNEVVGSNTQTIDLSALDKGFYFYKIINKDNVSHHGKLILQ
ncbi:MAG: ppiB [Bacteroidota bacterium]|jgi:cyclophilin family peptidyl-prolyl cis-trans isomerase|nr:ppiB [Bacteroidota bacterium]